MCVVCVHVCVCECVYCVYVQPRPSVSEEKSGADVEGELSVRGSQGPPTAPTVPPPRPHHACVK